MSAMIAAIRKGDLKKVKRLVTEGADVKERIDAICTPFLRAALRGHIPIMHWLLTEGGSSLAEQTLANGVSALLMAASGGHFAAVQYLLEEQGAKMTESDNFGYTIWSELGVDRRGRNNTG
jgi:ankyrin repeat protein